MMVMCVWMHACTHVCRYEWIDLHCTDVYRSPYVAYEPVYMYIYVYVCVCIHADHMYSYVYACMNVILCYAISSYSVLKHEHLCEFCYLPPLSLQAGSFLLKFLTKQGTFVNEYLQAAADGDPGE